MDSLAQSIDIKFDRDDMKSFEDLTKEIKFLRQEIDNLRSVLNPVGRMGDESISKTLLEALGVWQKGIVEADILLRVNEHVQVKLLVNAYDSNGRAFLDCSGEIVRLVKNYELVPSSSDRYRGVGVE